MKEGDQIVVDIESMLDDGYDVREPWSRLERVNATIIGTAGEQYEIEAIADDNFDNPNPYEKRGLGRVSDRYIQKAPSCPSCGSGRVFHDKRKEWFCPFCEGE